MTGIEILESPGFRNLDTPVQKYRFPRYRVSRFCIPGIYPIYFVFHGFQDSGPGIPEISISSRCIPLHDRNRDPGIPGIQKTRYPGSEISIFEISSLEALYSRDLFYLFCIPWISGFRSRDIPGIPEIPVVQISIYATLGWFS